MQNSQHSEEQKAALLREKEKIDINQHQERRIANLSKKLHDITEENSSLKSLLESTQKKCSYLTDKIEGDPFYGILAELDYRPSNNESRAFRSYQELEVKEFVFNTHIQKITEETKMLYKKLNDRDNKIIEQEKRFITLEREKEELTRENTFVKQELQIKNQQIQTLNNAIANYQSKQEKTQNELETVIQFMESKKQNDSINLNNLFKKFETFSQHIPNMVSEIKLEKSYFLEEFKKYADEKKTTEKQLLEELGIKCDRLTEENQELRKENLFLKTLPDNNTNIIPEIDYVEPKSFFLQDIISQNEKRDKKYKELLEKFNEMVIALQKSNEEKEILRENCLTLKEEREKSEKLTKEAVKFNFESEKVRVENKDLKSKIEFFEIKILELLEEIEALNQYIRDRIGTKPHIDPSEGLVEKYKMNYWQHEGQKWRNIKELVEINYNLSARLKGK